MILAEHPPRTRGSIAARRASRAMEIAARWLVGLAFLFAAIGKLAQSPAPAVTSSVDARRLAQATLFSRYIPEGSWKRPAAIGAELALAAWLFSGIARRPALLASALCLLAFSSVIAFELSKSHPDPCGCAGRIHELTPDGAAPSIADIRRELWIALGRNASLIGCCAGALGIGMSRRPLASGRGAEVSPQ